MLEKIPSEEELISIMGENIFKIWCDINGFIRTNYNIDFCGIKVENPVFMNLNIEKAVRLFVRYIQESRKLGFW